MHKLYLFLLLFSPLATSAQTTVEGTITDKSGEPLLGTNVYVKGTYDGTTSDINGNFSFTTQAQAEQILVVSFIGYETHEQSISLNQNKLVVNIILKEQFNKLDAVTITAGAFEASDEKKVTVLKPLDIVTTPSAVGDINGALQTLPGTTKNGESGRLFVRGGDGYETQTFIDGTMVQNPYGSSVPNVPTRGRFSPFMFSGTVFSTGGYSAEYGQALSSTLILNTNNFPEQSQGDISIMTVGADASYTHKAERYSVAGKVGYTNLAPYQALIPQNIAWDKAPQGATAEAIYRQKIRKTGLLKIYALHDQSQLAITSPDIDDANMRHTVALENDFNYLNLSYKEALNTHWSIKTGLGFNQNHDFVNPDSLFLNEKEKSLHAKAVAIGELNERVTLHTGIEWIGRNYNQSIQEGNTSLFEAQFNNQLATFFTEAEIYFSNSLVARLGLRGEYQSLLEDYKLAPRASLAYKTSDYSQFSLAYGDFYQAPKNDYLRIAPNLNPEKSSHYILNYQMVKNERTFRAELYHKEYSGLVKYKGSEIYNPLLYTNEGSGFARGLEIFWRDRKSIKATDYWVSYSFLDTKRDYKDYPKMAMPTFAAKHNLSVVVKHFVAPIRTQLGASYSIGSGRPYFDPEEEGFLTKKTKSYQDLSISAAFLFRQNIILFTSVSNVLGYKNVFGYEYGNQVDANGNLNRREVGQTAPRFIFMGLFITLTKDKKANQLDNL